MSTSPRIVSRFIIICCSRRWCFDTEKSFSASSATIMKTSRRSGISEVQAKELLWCDESRVEMENRFCVNISLHIVYQDAKNKTLHRRKKHTQESRLGGRFCASIGGKQKALECELAMSGKIFFLLLTIFFSRFSFLFLLMPNAKHTKQHQFSMETQLLHNMCGKSRN